MNTVKVRASATTMISGNWVDISSYGSEQNVEL